MRKILLSTLGITVFLGFVCILLFLLLPFIADRYLLPHIATGLPFPQNHLSISRISPWTLRGTMSLHENSEIGIRVPKFELRFTPANLFKKEISSLLIDSATIHLERRGGVLSIRGMSSLQKKSQSSEFALPPLPAKLEKLIIEESLIVLHQDGQSPVNLRVDGIVQLQYQEDKESRHLLTGAKGMIQTAGDLTTRTTLTGANLLDTPEISIKTHIPALRELMHLAPVPVNGDIHGSAFLAADITMDGLSKLGNYTANLKLSNLQLSSGTVVVTDAADDTPVVVNIKGSPDKIEVGTENLVIVKPETSPITISAEYQMKKKLFSGDIRLVPKKTQAEVNISMEGNHDDGAVAATFFMNGEPFTLTDNLFVAEQKAEGEVSYTDNMLAVKLRGAISQVKDAKRQVSLHNISLLLPYNSPLLAPELSIPGTLAIGEIRYKETNSGSLQAAVEVFEDKIVLNSLLTTPMSDDFAMKCNGFATLQRDMQMNCVLPEFEVNNEMLAGFVELPEGLSIAGKIGVETRLQLHGNNLSGNGVLKYSDGNISFDEFTLSGVAAQLHFPDYPHLRSSPSQLATIESIDLGKIEMSDARIKFRVDDAETLFIEGAKLNWSGGRVEAGGLRLYKDMEKVETTLYCDRLGYTELLRQLGIGNAEGEGSLNGRLPIFISKDGVRFDDGFLFSTPGNSGIVRFSNTDQLRQGMGAVSQTSYLDYSLSALENFAYNWTKLTFNTQEEELLLTLQLDGKPAEPLPYGYKKGQIVKTDKGSGLQHPIRLDVNFRLPLNELFRYGKNIQSLMENM